MSVCLPFAEINSASQLPNDEDVAVCADLGSKRRHVLQALEQLGWTKIGEQTQRRANLQKPRFGSHIQTVPLITADGTKQYCVSVSAGVECFRRQWIAVTVDCDATEIM